MGIFKRHNELKKRYEELSNNYELLVKRNKNLYDRDIEHQKKYKEKIHELKVENAKLKLELEDTRGFLKQERDAKEELLRQRNKVTTSKKEKAVVRKPVKKEKAKTKEEK